MRFRSKTLSGSENAPGFRENRLPEATFPPSVMHTALLFCDRHFAGRGKKRTRLSGALARKPLCVAMFSFPSCFAREHRISVKRAFSAKCQLPIPICVIRPMDANNGCAFSEKRMYITATSEGRRAAKIHRKND